MIAKQMKLNGAFKVPGLVVLKTIKKKPAREANGNASARNAKWPHGPPAQLSRFALLSN